MGSKMEITKGEKLLKALPEKIQTDKVRGDM